MSVRRLAAELGVSPSCVSLALRGHPRISPATRERVLAAARAAGYQPDARVAELMTRIRAPRTPATAACFAVMSLYPHPRPWEASAHLSRIYAGLERRAGELGYRLEPLWLRAPGMTPRRFRGILDARGIEGLVCFGSPVVDDPFPAALDHYAVVTMGLSVRTPLHRVTSHFFSDTWRALDAVRARGYRRPGLVLAEHEVLRGGHAHAGAYLGWCEQALGPGAALPVLRVQGVEAAPILGWVRENRPDSIVLVHLYDRVPEFAGVLARHGLRVPQDVGLAAVTQRLDGTGLAGMQQNQALMGAWAVELLASRIASGDLGFPATPRIEMVESEWCDGASLPPVGRARRAAGQR